MKSLRPISFAIVVLGGFLSLQACSSKEDLFDDSRKCSLQPENIQDIFGNVVKKAQKGDECPEVQFDPCNPQFKNQENLGEVTEDGKNSILVCPEVRDSPILPSDYTEDDEGAIDLSNSLPNEDEESSVQKILEQKSKPESETPPIPEQKREFQPILNKNLAEKRNSDEKAPVVSKPAKTPKKKAVSPPKNKKNSKTQKARKPSPPKAKAISRKTNLIDKISLGPFFRGKSYIPYSVKVSFEEHLHRIRRQHKNVKKWTYMAVGYTTSNSGQKVVLQRVRELLEYAVWKGKIDEKCFKLKVKATTKKALADRVEILVYMDN